MKLENYFSRNPDLVRQFEAIPWAEMGLDEAAVQGLRDVLDAAGDYIGRHVAGRAVEVDRVEVSHQPPVGLSRPMEENLKGLRELGLLGLPIPAQYGGAGLPFTAGAFVHEMLSRACPSTTVEFAFYAIPAALILRYGTPEQKRRWVPPLAEGSISGSVAMTEPEAGSDVGNLSTRAEPEGEGWWRIHGRKQFISNGQGELSIVLARCVPDSKGLDGLGLFLVPRRWPLEDPQEENFLAERAEEKVCLRGSTTCALSFEGAWGELLGEVGQGWQEILSFMNESRIGVAIQAVGQIQAAVEAARDYAAQRVQLGRPIREHPLVAEILLDMETSLAGLRTLVFEAAVLHDRTNNLAAEADPALTRRLRELTPLVKYLAAEEAVRLTRLALQVHGGYGVVREYDVERFVRDSLILPIYEGTSQIQALMATKDLLKAVGRRPLSLLDGGYSPALKGYRPPPWLRGYSSALGDLTASVRHLAKRALWEGKVHGKNEEERWTPALLHAERLTQMLAHLHLTRCLGEAAERSPELVPLARRAAWRAHELCHRLRREIQGGDGLVLERIEAWRREAAP